MFMHVDLELEDLNLPQNWSGYSSMYLMHTLSKKITEEQERKNQEVERNRKIEGWRGGAPWLPGLQS